MIKVLKNENRCDLIVCISHLGHYYNNDKISDIKLAKLTNMDKITSQEFGRIMADVMFATSDQEVANLISRTESDLEQQKLKEVGPDVILKNFFKG